MACNRQQSFQVQTQYLHRPAGRAAGVRQGPCSQTAVGTHRRLLLLLLLLSRPAVVPRECRRQLAQLRVHLVVLDVNICAAEGLGHRRLPWHRLRGALLQSRVDSG